MEYFLAVAESGSFRAASRQLNIAQPALSRTVRNLEEALGLKLIERRPGKLRLTPAGAAFAAGGPQLLADAWDLAHSAARASRGLTGQLRVAYTDFAIAGSLPAIVNAFRLHSPDVSIVFTPMVTADQITALREKEFDVGFLTGPVHHRAIEADVVQRDEVVLALPERHTLASGPLPSVASLADEPFVMGKSEQWAHFLSHVSGLCQEAGFLPRVVQEAADSEAILSLVAAGIGVTLNIESIASRPRPGVIVRRLCGTPYKVPTMLARRKRSDNPLVDRFCAIARATVNEMA